MFEILNIIPSMHWSLILLKCAIIVVMEIIMCYTSYKISIKKGYSGIRGIIATLICGIVYVICIGFLPSKEQTVKKECDTKTTIRPKKVKEEKESSNSSKSKSANGWTCPKCGAKNAKRNETCCMCGLHKC